MARARGFREGASRFSSGKIVATSRLQTSHSRRANSASQARLQFNDRPPDANPEGLPSRSPRSDTSPAHGCYNSDFGSGVGIIKSAAHQKAWSGSSWLVFGGSWLWCFSTISLVIDLGRGRETLVLLSEIKQPVA